MSKILLKRSSTASKVPATTDLSLGELAVNTYDGKLYLKKSVSGVESIVTIGGVTSITAGAGLTGGTITTSGTIALSTSGVTANTYNFPTIAVDSYGRITSATAGSYTITLTGDVTGTVTGNNLGSITLATTLNKNTPTLYTAQQNTATSALTISSGVVAWNLNPSNVYSLNLTQNATIAAPTNMVNGGTYMLMVKQSGGFTLGFDSLFSWPGGVIVPPSSTANTVTIYSFVCDGAKMYSVGVANYI